MMDRHTITVYDRPRRLVKTIPDAVRLGRLGTVTQLRASDLAILRPGSATVWVACYSGSIMVFRNR